MTCGHNINNSVTLHLCMYTLLLLLLDMHTICIRTLFVNCSYFQQDSKFEFLPFKRATCIESQR